MPEEFEKHSYFTQNLDLIFSSCDDLTWNSTLYYYKILNEVKPMHSVNSFTAVLRGYHDYRKYRKPVENIKLQCMYEPNNAFNRLAIKTVCQNGSTFGQLPREICRIKNFIWTWKHLCMLNWSLATTDVGLQFKGVWNLHALSNAKTFSNRNFSRA